MEKYLVFYYGEKELVAYTLRGSYSGERKATIKELAAEHSIPQAEIYTKIELRG